MSPETFSRFLIALFAGLLCCTSVHAESGQEAQASGKAPEIGATTANLLELQRSGLAAGKAQPIGGDVAGRSYKRYLDSFQRPMPEGRDGAASAPTSVAGKSGTTTGTGGSR